ncbi:MAG TPA: VWA domain-containing protein [Anaerolineales bacterium]|nr:VWA domain-containing protein [Anaerolineales bacterium]
MSFIWSNLLIFLLLVPLLLVIYLRVHKRRREAAARFGTLGMLRNAQGSGPGTSRHIPVLILLAGITVLIVSAARPQATVSLPRLEGTVILTFDVSGSMSADDLKPTRMEAAKAAASQFVEKQPQSIAIGVVAFSDGGITVQAPTNNHEESLATIDRLVPRRGTSLANGILSALNTIALDAGDPAILKTSGSGSESVTEPVPAPQGWYPSAVIVLLSDGENNQEPDPLMASALAADLGVRVYTVGIGSTAGTTITVEGFTVHSQLNEPLLQAISNETGGNYYSAASEEELIRIYNDLEPKLSIKTEEMEITSIFAGIGMLALLIGGALSLLWFGRVP